MSKLTHTSECNTVCEWYRSEKIVRTQHTKKILCAIIVNEEDMHSSIKHMKINNLFHGFFNMIWRNVIIQVDTNSFSGSSFFTMQKLR